MHLSQSTFEFQIILQLKIHKYLRTKKIIFVVPDETAE
jgi:hypothetical protein